MASKAVLAAWNWAIFVVVLLIVLWVWSTVVSNRPMIPTTSAEETITSARVKARFLAISAILII